MHDTPCDCLVIMSLPLGLTLWEKAIEEGAKKTCEGSLLKNCNNHFKFLNPFHANGPFLYYLDASENLMFSQGIERDQCNKIGEKLSSINFTQFILEYFSQI